MGLRRLYAIAVLLLSATCAAASSPFFFGAPVLLHQTAGGQVAYTLFARGITCGAYQFDIVAPRVEVDGADVSVTSTSALVEECAPPPPGPYAYRRAPLHMVSGVLPALPDGHYRFHWSTHALSAYGGAWGYRASQSFALDGGRLESEFDAWRGRLYRELLDRAEDPGARAHWIEAYREWLALELWAGRLRSGQSRHGVVAQFLVAREWQAAWANPLPVMDRPRPSAVWTADLYRAVLKRSPEAGGLRSWIPATADQYCEWTWPQHERATHESLARQARSFYLGEEYRRSSRADFVSDLYAGLLRRAAEDTGWQYWAMLLSAGLRSREQLLEEFLASDEFRERVKRLSLAAC